VTAMDRAVTLCSQTLDYAQSDEPELEPTQFSLRRLIDDVAEIIAMDTEIKIDWVNDVPEDIDVTADHIQLFRVFQNLSRNALDVMPDGGRICFSARREDDEIVIDVADNGPGVPERARADLFQPFAGSVRPGGSGLGLAIARENMRLHGGDITLAETGAHGTRFRLNLPIA